jgi:hypothetical protein
MPQMPDAKWIWIPDGHDEGTFYFRKTIDGQEDEAGKLLIACDNEADVYLNGRSLGKTGSALHLYRFDLRLSRGKNVLAIAARNPKGPGGLLAKVFLGGRGVPTDQSWKVTREQPAGDWQSIAFDDSQWKPAKEEAPNGGGPWGAAFGYPYSIPADFPRFSVPDHDAQLDSLRALLYLHYAPAGPLIPLWDEWMTSATLWEGGAAGVDMRRRWASALSSRPMGPDGYVFTLQHDGTAHAQGWPFPLWQQGGGVGWHFASTGIPGYDAPLVKEDGWQVTGAKSAGIDPKGWNVDVTDTHASIAHAGFTIDAKRAPWLRLNWWAAGLEGANPYVEWTTKDDRDFSPARRMYFSPANSAGDAHTYMPVGGGNGQLNTAAAETRTMIPAYRHPAWKGTLTSFRINFDNPAPAKVVIKSFHTAFDSRQTVNNLNYIRGCAAYFAWTGDYAFLRSQMPRMRTALRFMLSEFDTRHRKCVYTTWPGHEGRSGVRVVNGKKTIVAGEGIGSNYWDLLPFGGEDALATVYYYDTLQKLADVEEQIARHPEWAISRGADAYDPADLRKHAGEVRDYGTQRFWNPETQRFGTVDLDGQMHDYGFTFLNNEAIYFNFATPDQAKSIRAWIDGRRVVAGDTSTGDDIYHFRFGPRSTTKRNVDYYFWAWSNPESISFGDQVQDGGAVLGWSYHDLMAILKVDGPDAAAARLSQIIKWFEETQDAGGYRKYYTEPGRGTMQGANVAGGLGLDKEFFESVLVPQVLLYGFLGLRATPDRLTVSPNLPKDWPSLTITHVQYRDTRLDITATPTHITIRSDRPTDSLVITGPDETWSVKQQGSQIEITKK